MTEGEGGSLNHRPTQPFFQIRAIRFFYNSYNHTPISSRLILILGIFDGRTRELQAPLQPIEMEGGGIVYNGRRNISHMEIKSHQLATTWF